MIRPSRKSIQYLAAVTLLFGGPQVLNAQSGAESEQSVSGDLVLEEIIVTATKREQSVRDIPTSIDAFTGADLSAIGAATLDDIVKLSAGVVLEPGFTPNSSTVQIRGITNETRGVGPRTVGRFYGGVPLVNPSIIGSQPDIDTVDMQTVEVLKGPQGTLFGGSALAGAIRYVPNLPDFDGFHGSASLGYGNTASSDGNNEEYTLMLNAPLGDSFALRFAGAIRDYPGYIYDETGDNEDINSYQSEHGRLTALWQITDRFSARANYLTQSGDAGAYSFVEGDQASRVRQFKYLPEYEDSELDTYGVRFDWSTDNFDIVFDSNWLEKERSSQVDLTYLLSFQGTGITVIQNFFPTTDQRTHELRIVSTQPSGGGAFLRDWQYVVGLFYMEADQSRPGTVDIDLGTAVLHSIGGAFADATEKALYFDLSRAFSDKWELNLGGRFFDQVTDGGNFISGGGGLGVPDGASAATLDEDGFNPKAALMFHANENVTIYASAVKGFRFGGINGDVAAGGAAGVPVSYDSDSLVNYELGIRTNWMNQRVTADLAAFSIDWSDMQIQQRAGVLAYVDNIGEAKSTGFELTVNALLSAGFSTRLTAGYTDSRTTVDFDSPTGGLFPSGTRLPQAPEWSGAANLSYDGSWSNWDVFGSLTYSYRGDSHNNLDNTVPLKAYGTTDLAIGIGSTTRAIRPRFSLIGKNLTDENVATYAFSLGGVNLVSMTMPRQIMLKIDLDF